MRTYDGELRVVEEGASCEFVFRRDFALLLWGHGIVKERATAFGKALQRDFATAPRVATLVWLTGLPASAPTDDVRVALARNIANAPPTFVGLHYVVEGEGFGSAVARSVITGLNLMAKPTLEVAVHADVPAALGLVARQLGWKPFETQAVARGLGTLRTEWAQRGGTALPTEIPAATATLATPRPTSAAPAARTSRHPGSRGEGH